MRLILVILTTIIFISCNNKIDTPLDFVAKLSGQEITLPNNLHFQILSHPINKKNWDNSDFFIITIIDSAGCTPCQMKLSVWKSLINEFKTHENTNVGFLMIINPNQKVNIDSILKHENFLHPISFDTLQSFKQANTILGDNKLNTLLLDRNHHILVVGNPTVNPKVKELYRKTIYGNDTIRRESQFCIEPIINIGTFESGDTIHQRFEIINRDNKALTIRSIKTSNDSIVTFSSTDYIEPGEITYIYINYAVDSIHEDINEYIDVYFNEIPNGEGLTFYGHKTI